MAAKWRLIRRCHRRLMADLSRLWQCALRIEVEAVASAPAAAQSWDVTTTTETCTQAHRSASVMGAPTMK
jgi:hypothetical protein